MINHSLIALSLRAHALTLSVCTTGAASIAATATGFSRVTGSFLNDGFVVGQEISTTGFIVPANNGGFLIAAVDDLTLSCTGTTAESAGVGVITVGLPVVQAWENIVLNPQPNQWYLEENYLPGPVTQITVGPNGELEGLPMYVLKLYAPKNTGIRAIYSVSDALLNLFAPRTAITLSSGDVVRVRTTPAPYRSQLLQADPGWAVIAITIPCLIRTPNQI